ncbi:MAG: DUF748 domain-containing protein [Planctomycetota bacterium]
MTESPKSSDPSPEANASEASPPSEAKAAAEGAPAAEATAKVESPDTSGAKASPSEGGKPKRKGKWRRRVLLAMPVFALAYVVFGFFGVPLVVRYVALPFAKKYFKGDIAIEAIHFNPITFVAGADGIVVTDPGDPDDASNPVASVGSFRADFELWSVLSGTPRFAYIRVDAPSARVVRRADGTINLLAMLTLPESEPSTEPPPSITVDEVTVTNGGASWTDQTLSPAFEFVAGDFNLNVAGFNTREGGPVDLSVVLGQACKLSLAASVDPSGPAVEVTELSLEGLEVGPLGAYAQGAPITITSGALHVEGLQASANLSEGGEIPAATASGLIRIDDLSVAVGDGLAKVDGLNLSLPLEGVSTTDWSLGLGRIVVEVASAEVTVPTPPQVDPDAVQDPPTSAGEVDEDAAPSLPILTDDGRVIVPGIPGGLLVELGGVDVNVKQLTVIDGAGEDGQTGAEAHGIAGLVVRDLGVEVGAWNSASDPPITLGVDADLPEGGVVWVEGSLAPAADVYDSDADVSVRVRALPLPRFRATSMAWAGIGFDKGWLDLDVEAGVVDGRLTLAPDVALHRPEFVYAEDGPLPSDVLNTLEMMRQVFDPTALTGGAMRLSPGDIQVDLRDPSVSLADVPGLLAETLLASLLNTGASMAEGLATGAADAVTGGLGAVVSVFDEEAGQAKLTATTAKRIAFTPGTAEPADAKLAQRILAFQAQRLEEDGERRLLVVGLSDPESDDPPQDLADQRAAAVVEALEAAGVPADRVTSRGEVSVEGAGSVVRIRLVGEVAPIGSEAP